MLVAALTLLLSCYDFTLFTNVVKASLGVFRRIVAALADCAIASSTACTSLILICNVLDKSSLVISSPVVTVIFFVPVIPKSTFVVVAHGVLYHNHFLPLHGIQYRQLMS